MKPERERSGRGTNPMTASTSGNKETLGISTDDIKVVSGNSSPSKVIAITGMDHEAIQARLE